MAKHVQFDSPPSVHLASPSLSFTSETSSISSTSTLQYLNSQLQAHGFTSSPGLSLDGLSTSDSERVAKCLLSMLSTRVNDMARTEDLTTRLRTLSYDHERLQTMYRSANDKVSNAEKEVNLHKSRLAATTRTLSSTTASHKATTLELQRTRTSLQSLRVLHQTELKKKEKEVEKIIEKWSKLSDVQAKLAAAGSGLKCANGSVLDGLGVMVGGKKGKSLLEGALEDAESARKALAEDNHSLRGLVLKTVNDLQAAVSLARSEQDEERTLWTQTTLFPLQPSAPTSFAADKLTSLIATLCEAIEVLHEKSLDPKPKAVASPFVKDNGEVVKMQEVIASLREELERTQNQATTETRSLFDQYAATLRQNCDQDRDISMDLMIAPAVDSEKERLLVISKNLEKERKKFTEAAIGFGKERAGFEAEKVKFEDEKRRWQVDAMLADLPPTPAIATEPTSPLKKSRSPSGQRHRTPAKKTRISRRSSLGRGASPTKKRKSFSPPSKPGFEPSYETEFILPPPPQSSKNAFTEPLLPTTFVLPPPSPFSSLPKASAIPPMVEDELIRAEPGPPAIDAVFPPVERPVVPRTPRPFPVAKPFARGMVHAYSPAKPSPLSRILMLGDSPPVGGGGGNGGLGVVMEDVQAEEMFPAVPRLAAELGVDEDGESEDSPLKERRVEMNVIKSRPSSVEEKKRFTAKEKGKGKASNEPVASAGHLRHSKKRAPPAGSVEKENDTKRTRLGGGGGSGEDNGKKVVGVGETRPRAGSKVPLPKPGSGVARRVPIDSSEVGRGWRG